MDFNRKKETNIEKAMNELEIKCNQYEKFIESTAHYIDKLHNEISELNEVIAEYEEKEKTNENTR